MQHPGFDPYANLASSFQGAAQCPACRGVGAIVPHPEFVAVCSLCGAPRIPSPDGTPPPEVATTLLRNADAARKKRSLFRGLGIFGIVGTVFGAFVSLPIFFFSFLAALITLGVIAGPSVLAILLSRGKQASLTKEIATAIEAAWMQATTELVRRGVAKTPADIARAFGIPEARAQHFFTAATVEAEIGGLRVDTGTGPTIGADPRFAALEARFAREQSAETEAQAALDAQSAQAKSRVGP
ncbi:MAG: hypothetical protein U0271_42520 [Polyangiaceae bacterium]